MTPAQFLELTRTAAAARSRSYRASGEGGQKETYLTLHAGTEFHCLPYGQMRFATGSEGGTLIRLTFQMTFVVKGMQLARIFEGIRTHRVAHLYLFDGAAYDPPPPGAPIITAMEVEAPKPAAGRT